MNDITFLQFVSTPRYSSTGLEDLDQLDLEFLGRLPLLLEHMTDGEKEALLNFTGFDESTVLHLSSKFVFSKSCDEQEDLDQNYFASKSLHHENLLGYEDRKFADVPLELKVQKAIILYVPLIIYLVGLIGNCLSLSVLIRRRMRRVSTYTYLAALSVVDTMVLTFGLLQIWADEVTGTSIRTYSDVSCKIVSALGYTVSDLSVWLIIAVTVERFIAVCYPLRAATTCRRKTAVKVILALLVALIFVNSNFFWTTKIQIHKTEGPVVFVINDSGKVDQCPAKYDIQRQCTAAEGYEFLVVKFWPWLDAIIYSFLPFVVIIVLNSLIISRVVSARRKRCRMTTHLSTPPVVRNEVGKADSTLVLQIQQDKSPVRITHNSYVSKPQNSYCDTRQDAWKRDKQPSSQQFYVQPVGGGRREPNETNFMLSLMLLTISFAFLLMTLPMNVMMIINNIWNASKTSSSATNHQQWARYLLASTITELLMYLNHSTNFFLYCATGQKFRIELKRMMTGWREHRVCGRACCGDRWNTPMKEQRHGNRQLDWSLQNHNANQTMQEKSQANQTIIMNIITCRNN